MGVLIIILIVVAVFYVMKKKNERWYNGLTTEEKIKINQLNIKLKEVNVTIKNIMPKEYGLYKLLYNLSNNLTKDEEILFFTRFNTRVEDIATQNGPGGFIYITNKKILITDKQVKSLPLEKINSVTSEKKGILISDNITATKLLGIPKDDIIKMVKVINNGIEKHKSISINITQITEKDVSDKIARLKALYDEGILTEYEFNIKKMELLEKAK